MVTCHVCFDNVLINERKELIWDIWKNTKMAF